MSAIIGENVLVLEKQENGPTVFASAKVNPESYVRAFGHLVEVSGQGANVLFASVFVSRVTFSDGHSEDLGEDGFTWSGKGASQVTIGLRANGVAKALGIIFEWS